MKRATQVSVGRGLSPVSVIIRCFPVGMVLLLPLATNASPINWEPGLVQYTTSFYGGGMLSERDQSVTLGTDASISIPYYIHDWTGVAGDNGVRSLRAYADCYYDLSGGTGWFIDSHAAQWWSFSLDHAATLEFSYSLNGSLSKSGSRAMGDISASLIVYRIRWVGFGSWWEPLFTYTFQTGANQAISEHGDSTFYYDPFEYPPPFNWSYEIGVSIDSLSAGWSPSIPPPVQETTVITQIDDFSVTLTEVGAPVVPVPGAILLVSIGAGLVTWLHRRRTL